MDDSIYINAISFNNLMRNIAFILGKTDINGEAIQILQKLTFEDFQSLFQNQEYQNNKSFGKIQKQLKNAMYQLIDVEHLYGDPFEKLGELKREAIRDFYVKLKRLRQYQIMK